MISPVSMNWHFPNPKFTTCKKEKHTQGWDEKTSDGGTFDYLPPNCIFPSVLRTHPQSKATKQNYYHNLRDVIPMVRGHTQYRISKVVN